MPNSIAYVTLLIWPVVIATIFFSFKPKSAIIYAVFCSYLILPVKTSFDLAGLPELDKTTISNISIFIFAVIFGGFKISNFPNSKILTLAIVIFIISPIFTTYNNNIPIFLNHRTIPAMSWYDGLSVFVNQIFTIVPFLIGAQLLNNEESHRKLLFVLVFSCLIYSLPMLLEVRLSPQLHTWIYGFLPHDFGQQVRAGGYRPMVFLGHGLLVAIFTAMAFISAICLAKMKTRVLGFSPVAVSAYLLAVLILCKSLGAIIIATAFAPLVMIMKTRKLALVSAVLALIVLCYPALRGGGLIPVDTISQLSGSVDGERQESLAVRLKNEDALLEKAAEKPFFGWGTWGRNRLYEGWNNADSTITDGTWIIVVGTYGWVGYLACFGLLCYPLVAQFRKNRLYRELSFATIGLGIVHLVNLLDLIPNSSLSPLTWLIAGALAGNLSVKTARKRPNVQDAPTVSGTSGVPPEQQSAELTLK
jgi:hypothetical protein